MKICITLGPVEMQIKKWSLSWRCYNSLCKDPLRGKMNSREAGRWGLCESVNMDVLGCSAPEEVSTEKAV